MSKLNDYDAVADIYDTYVRADFDLEFFVQEVARVPGPVLELMAGTGRVSQSVAEVRGDLTCVDSSLRMLQVLKSKTAPTAARVACADVRALPLRPRYALALIPFHSFAELIEREDQLRTLREIHRVLVPAGRFVCTLHNPAMRTQSLTGQSTLRGSFALPSGEGTVELWTEESFDAVTRVAESLQDCRIFDAAGELRSERVQKVRFALIERAELEEMAGAVGFRVVELYGDYERSQFSPRESPHMIWTLEKVGG